MRLQQTFRGVNLGWLLGIAAMVLLGPECNLSASSIVGSFTLNGGGLAKGATRQLCWDAQKGNNPVKHNCFTINTGTMVTDADVATQLAADINNKVGAGTATATSNEVQLPGFSPSEPLKTNEYSYTMDEFYFAAGLSTSIKFNPDLDTGTTALTSPGSFDLTGPNGLNVAFSAPSGTSDTALAASLSTLMNANGYHSTVMGSGVLFQTLAAGNIGVTATGAGIDIAFGSVIPEPGSCILMGIGLLAIIFRSESSRAKN